MKMRRKENKCLKMFQIHTDVDFKEKHTTDALHTRLVHFFLHFNVHYKTNFTRVEHTPNRDD